MAHLIRLSLTIVAVALMAARAQAEQTDATKSLARCQRAISKEVLRYGAAYQKEVGKCVDAYIKVTVQRGETDLSRVAKKCGGAFRKLMNTEKPEKTLAAKMAAKIGKACDPDAVKSRALHLEQDIFGSAAQELDGSNLTLWCVKFEGADPDATGLDDLDEWISCLTAAATCGAQQALATKYPRLLEALEAVRAPINVIDPIDPAIVDALAALDAVDAAIEGSTDDNVPEIVCAGRCGNRVLDPGEECELGTLEGATCKSLGFAAGGALGCSSSCTFDTSGCSNTCVAEVDCDDGNPCTVDTCNEMGGCDHTDDGLPDATPVEDAAEQNDTLAAARELPPESCAELTSVPATENDYFRVFIAPGPVHIELLSNVPAANFTLEWLDPAGTSTPDGMASGTGPSLDVVADVLGHHYIRVQETTNLAVHYRLVVVAEDVGVDCVGRLQGVSDPDGFEDNDSTSMSAELPINGCRVVSVFPAGDTDFFRVFADPGPLEVQAFSANPAMDLTLSLYDPYGGSLGAATGINPIRSVAAPTRGFYTIQVNADPGELGNYRLVTNGVDPHLSCFGELPTQDPNAPAGAIGADAFEENDSPVLPADIGSDGCLDVTIYPVSDPDYYRFYSSAGTITVEAFSGDFNMNLSLALFDPRGAPVDAASGPNPTLGVSWGVNGYYMLQVLETSGTAGGYRLVLKTPS